MGMAIKAGGFLAVLLRLAIAPVCQGDSGGPALTPAASFALNPVPAALESKRGLHPKLFLDEARFVDLRSAITTTPAPLWRKIRDQADAADFFFSSPMS